MWCTLQRWIFSPIYADVFNLRLFDLSPGLGLPPSIQFDLLSMYINTYSTAIGQKKASSHTLFFTRDTRNRYGEKSWGQTHLVNIWTIGAMDRTSGRPQVRLILLLRSISLKIRPFYVQFLHCTVHTSLLINFHPTDIFLVISFSRPLRDFTVKYLK